MPRTIQNRLEDAIAAHGGKRVETKIRRSREYIKMSIGNLFPTLSEADRAEIFIWLGPSGSMRSGKTKEASLSTPHAREQLLREQP